MSTSQRLKLFFDHMGLSVREVERALGFSNGSISVAIREDRVIGSDRIEKICQAFPDLNPKWLLIGVDNMLLHDSISLVEEPQSLYKSGIPMVDAVALAGNGGFEVNITKHDYKLYSMVDVKADFLIRVEGNSMVPKLYPGDVVACRIIRDSNFIQWGKVYLIATPQGILIKRLRRGTNDASYTVVSENKDYDSFELPIEDCHGLALVVAFLRIE